jgi:peptide deformylase
MLVPVQIIDKSKTIELDEEGCLSFPKIYADLEVRSI